MAMMINGSSNNNTTHFDSFRSLSILNQNRIANQKEVQRTSTTALNINDAIDNVSAYTIAESLRIRTRVLGQASENIQNDTALLRTAQKSGDSIVDSIKEIQRLAVSATDESITDDDRRVIQKDINRLVNQISGDAQTTFNGRNLIDGSATTGNQAIATVLSNNSLFSGTTANTALTALQNSSGVNLGIEVSDRITASYVKDGNIYTTSFSVGNNTLEDIFVNLNKVNGVTTADNELKTQSFTDAAFVGGGSRVLINPNEIKPQDPEELNPGAAPIEPTLTVQEPEEVLEPTAFAEREDVFIPSIQSEAVPTAPSDTEVNSAYGDLETAVNAIGNNLPEGLGGFISSLQSEMLQRQDDGSINVLSNLTESASYQALSDEEKATVDANAEAINTALAGSGYADKVGTYNIANAEYNTAMAQYETDKALYDTAIEAGANVINPGDEGYDEAVGDISEVTNFVQSYKEYQTEVSKYNQYLTDKQTYDDALAVYNQEHEQWDKDMVVYNTKLEAYNAYKNEYETTLRPQYDAYVEYYNEMAANVIQNDGTNGLSLTAQKPGLEGQISGVSINVTDSSGNARLTANAALNNFRTTTFADDERKDNSMNFQIGETVGQTMNFGFNDMRAEAFGLKGTNGNIISISTKEDADAALSTINNALDKATEYMQSIGSSEKRLGYIADSLAIEISNIQEPDSLVRNAGMAKTLTVQTIDIFHRDRMQSMFAMANQHASSVLALLR